MSFLGIHNYFEIAAFIASVVLWYKIRNTKLRWLMPYLLFIVIVELVGRYIKYGLGLRNGWLYNISVPIEYLFFSYLFYCYYQTNSYKILAKWFLLLFPFFVLVNIFFIQGLSSFNNNLLKAGSFSMIVFCCLYFFDLLKIEIVVNPLRETLFWITSGLLLFNVGEFVYIALSNTLFNDWTTFRSLVKKINNNLVYVLYSCIIIGLLLNKWDKEETI